MINDFNVRAVGRGELAGKATRTAVTNESSHCLGRSIANSDPARDDNPVMVHDPPRKDSTIASARLSRIGIKIGWRAPPSRVRREVITTRWWNPRATEYQANQRLRGSPEAVTLFANEAATNPETRTPAKHPTDTHYTSQQVTTL